MQAYFQLRTINFIFCLSISLCGFAAQAQTTAFTYQGKLNDGGSAANGAYDMKFRLFDNPTAGQGNQLGSTVINPSVQVANGIFTVPLDFGAGVFAAGANLYLEISLRPAGSQGGYTSLAPRQFLTSAPYAVRAASAGVADNAANATTAANATNAANLGNVPASSYVQTNDSRLSDARAPLAGSNNYIQNSAAQQPSASFNIAGNGTVGGAFTANKITSGTDYFIGVNRVLSVAKTSNMFAGINSGVVNTFGNNNAFFGYSAGQSNTTGAQNSFFGSSAGQSNIDAADNSFFGYRSGKANVDGADNSFFGSSSGEANTSGSGNAFFGKNAGTVNTTGNINSFFGYFAGNSNLTGSENSFFGNFSGSQNLAGVQNSFFGSNSGFKTTGNINSFFGFRAGYLSTTGFDNTFIGARAGEANVTGFNNTLLGKGADVGSSNLSFATAIGSGAVVSTSNTIVLGRADGSDKVRVPGLGAAGLVPLCRNALLEISTCGANFTAEDEKAAKLDALNEQNSQMRQQLRQQQILIDGLKKIVCTQNPQAEICR